MTTSEVYKRGEAIRRKLRGEEDFKNNQASYASDPVMKKFIDGLPMASSAFCGRGLVSI